MARMARGQWLKKLRTWAVSEDKPEDGGYDFEHGRKSLSAELWSLGIGAAVAGYFAADYVEFAPAIDRATLGVGFLAFAILLHRGVSARVNWKRTAWLAPIIFSLIALMFFSSDYMNTLRETAMEADSRCARIQHEMLAPHPRRDDLPAIFAALGCQPSGTEDISFPAQSRR
jgi:hypothetical protein